RNRPRSRRREHRAQTHRQRQDRHGPFELLRLRRHQRLPRLPALPLMTTAPGKLMAGKRGLIMGVANDHSIGWGIAKALHEHGAELAFTYQTEAFGKRVKPLVESIGSKFIVQADVEDDQSLERAFGELERKWGSLDFLVHAIAYSDKNELKGRY